MTGRMRALMPAMALAMAGAGSVDAAPSKKPRPSVKKNRSVGFALTASPAFADRYYRGIGNAIRSRKRDVRRLYGEITGRQWRNLRKQLRRAVTNA